MSDRAKAYDLLNKLLSNSSVPVPRRSKPKWLLKHLEPDVDNREKIIELCTSIVQRGWS